MCKLLNNLTNVSTLLRQGVRYKSNKCTGRGSVRDRPKPKTKTTTRTHVLFPGLASGGLSCNSMQWSAPSLETTAQRAFTHFGETKAFRHIWCEHKAFRRMWREQHVQFPEIQNGTSSVWLAEVTQFSKRLSCSGFPTQFEIRPRVELIVYAPGFCLYVKRCHPHRAKSLYHLSPGITCFETTKHLGTAQKFKSIRCTSHAAIPLQNSHNFSRWNDSHVTAISKAWRNVTVAKSPFRAKTLFHLRKLFMMCPVSYDLRQLCHEFQSGWLLAWSGGDSINI